MLRVLRLVLNSLRTVGLGKTCETIIHRLAERRMERRFGSSTSGLVSPEDLGIERTSSVGYCPTDYICFRNIMKHVKIRKDKDIFVDYGSGKGRVVIVAATYPFRKVIGVEYSPELDAIARENVRNALPRLRCKDVELAQADAAQWPLPKEATVLFFNNPFRGPVLARVFDRIASALAEEGRRLLIVYIDPSHFEKEIPWQDWFTKEIEIPFSNIKCAIYRSKITGGGPPATSRESEGDKGLQT